MSDSCNQNVYDHGKSIGILGNETKDEIEAICQETQKRTGHAVDWHYVGGRANILTLGPPAEVQQVFNDVVAGKPPEGCAKVEDER